MQKRRRLLVVLVILGLTSLAVAMTVGYMGAPAISAY